MPREASMKTLSLAEEHWEAIKKKKKKIFDLAVEKEIKPNKSNNNVLIVKKNIKAVGMYLKK